MKRGHDFALIIVGRILMALISFISLRAVTSYLSPAQYGELSLLVMIQAGCILLLINPVDQHINLHTHVWNENGTLTGRLASYKKYVLSVSAVGGIALVGLHNDHGSHGHILWSALIMSIMIASASLNGTIIWMLNMLGFRAAAVFCGVFSASASVASSIVFVAWLPSSIAWFSGQAIGMAAGAVAANHVFNRYVKPIPAKNSAAAAIIERREVFNYCLPLALATGLMWIQLSGYRIFIEAYWGLANLGFMVIGLQLASQLWGLTEIVAMHFLHPLFFWRVSAKENESQVRQAFSDLLNTMVPVYFVINGFLISCADYLLKILVSSQYHDAVFFVIIGAGIEMCRVLGNVLSNAAHVRRKAKSLSLPYGIGATTCISLLWIIGQREIEITWAGVSLLIGSVFMLVAMIVTMYRKIEFTIDMVRFLIGGALMFAMAICACWLPSFSAYAANLAMIFLIGLLTVILSAMLLWKNPATIRFLNIKLANKLDG